MTCERLSDRMPAVAHGRDQWSRYDQDHLRTCADCSAEWSLVRRTVEVGRGLDLVYPVRMGQQVLHRLATEPSFPRWIRPLPVVGVAAAIVLLAILLSPGDSVVPGIIKAEATVLEIPIELDSLTPDQLQTVLESIEDPLTGPSSVDLPSLMDLDDQQLERVIRSMEG